MPGAGASLELTRPVTAIAVDPADNSGKSIYITFGRLGEGDYRHVWHFNGTRWEPRSGPEPPSITPITPSTAGARPHPIAADPVNLRLMDVHTNAIAVDPANPSHLYVGADIGIWRSTDAGKTWSTFSSRAPRRRRP